jgi:hypothetical protein
MSDLYEDGYEYNCAFKTDIGWRTARFNVDREFAKQWDADMRAKGLKTKITRRPILWGWERVQF